MAANYDVGVDYSALIAEEAAKGVGANRALLAAYETARNEKIAGEGLNYAQTHIYTEEADVPRHYYTATDQSDYVDELYSAARSRALSALEGAYSAEIAALDAEESALPETYRAARNAVSGDSAVERQNMNESFAATGLNNGAAGQARLAMSTELLGSLSALSADEARQLSDIAARRTSAMGEYQSAIASAIAENELGRAQALYDEAVRVDESYREAAQEIELQNAYLSALPSYAGQYASRSGTSGTSGSGSSAASSSAGTRSSATSTGSTRRSGGGGGRSLAAIM